MAANNLGRVIRLLRVDREIKQADLARKAGLTQSTMSAMENGNALTPANVEAISGALGLSASQLHAMAEAAARQVGANAQVLSLADDLARLLDPGEMEALFERAAREIPPVGSPAGGSNVSGEPCPNVVSKPWKTVSIRFNSGQSWRVISKNISPVIAMGAYGGPAKKLALRVGFKILERPDGTQVWVPVIEEAHGIEAHLDDAQLKALKSAFAVYGRRAMHGVGSVLSAGEASRSRPA
jgi:transcriptional regulator with XRE-family HTH domain